MPWAEDIGKQMTRTRVKSIYFYTCSTAAEPDNKKQQHNYKEMSKPAVIGENE